jgi:hypothetical protein
MGVIIGMDPHKLSATIEVLDAVHGQFIGLGCYGTDREGYVAILARCAAVSRSGCGRWRAVTASGGTTRAGTDSAQRRERASIVEGLDIHSECMFP